jgi:hypothetical protein
MCQWVDLFSGISLNAVTDKNCAGRSIVDRCAVNGTAAQEPASVG